MKILLCGGGTGGHILPIVAIAEKLKKHAHFSDKKIELLWVGERGGQEKAIAKKYHIPFKSIFCGKIRRYFSLKNVIDIFKFPVGLLEAKRVVKKFKPDVIFGKGGYVSAPVILGARNYKIPIYIHDSDAVPGQANLSLAKYARKIFVTFPESKKYFKHEEQNKIIISGLPLREGASFGNKREGYRVFGLEYSKPVILVMGGSQGAKKINDVMFNLIPKVVEKYQIIHFVGKRNVDEISKRIKNLTAFQQKNYHFFASIEGKNFFNAVAAADLVISRGGANSLFELAAMARPAIIIPYPHASANHQIKNAQFFTNFGAIKVILEKESLENDLERSIDDLMGNQEIREEMRKSIYEIYRQGAKDAAELIVNEILKP